MSRPLEDSEAVEDPNASEDDGQLTIRIPNPKVYLARQSQWVGRRGKPRCDYCRTSNLKCDRVLPTCNHCSWSIQQECTYTPLPTPAHRGIPRCDRCRDKNMKCDRSLPVCNNCAEGASGRSCNYTPKKRHKSRDGHSVSVPTETSPRKWSKLPLDLKVEPSEPRAHLFYEKNVSSSRGRAGSSSLSDVESDLESNHTGRFTAEFAQLVGQSSTGPYGSSGPTASLSRSDLPFISDPPPSDSKLITSTLFEPWIHPSFTSLPNFVSQRLRYVDPVEIPKKLEFDQALETFQNSLIPALQETALFSVQKYRKLAKCLKNGDTSTLTDRVQIWTSVHRLCSGSSKYSIVLVPRDSVFSMEPAAAEADRRNFVDVLLSGKADADKLQVHHHDRLPVQNQLYDILTYAHRSHLPAAQMLLEVVRLRFAFVTWPMAEMYVRLCPLCNLRAKQAE